MTGFWRKTKKEKIPAGLVDKGTIKVVAIGCVVLVVSMFVMSFTGFFIARSSIVNKLKTRDLMYMAQSIGAVIDGRVEKAIACSLLLATDPTMESWVEGNEKDETMKVTASQKMGELVMNLGFDTAFLTSARTNKYWSFNNKSLQLLETVSKDDPADVWFFNALAMKERYEINIDHNVELKDTYVWINTLMGNVNNPAAVTGVGMRLGDITEELASQDSKYGIQNDVWLVDSKGIIYLSKDESYLKKDISAVLPGDLENQIIQSNISSTGFETLEYKNSKGELYDLVYKNIKNTGWKLIIQIPRSQSLGFLNAIIYNSLLACIIMVVLIVIMFNILANRVANPYKRAVLLNQELESKVNERTKELSEKNIKISDSIEYAKKIQETILPSKTMLEQIFSEYFVIWRPRDIVGGDFYWARKFDDGVLVIAGDCTGHGVPGALMTMAVNSILDRIIDGCCHNDPSDILQELDRLLEKSLGRSGDENSIQDGLDAGIVYVFNDKRILFAGAHISLFISSEDGISEIKGNTATLGCDKDQRIKTFANHEIAYKSGMTLYLATDGLKDQPGGLKKLAFGKSRIINILEAVRGLPMDQQGKGLLEAYDDYISDEIPRDDMTVIGFKID